MTTVDDAGGWETAVRRRIALGTLLPLGDAADGAWLAEQAAVGELRRCAAEVPGVTPGRMRFSLALPDAPGVPAAPPPPGALPPGPLLVNAEFAAMGDESLPELAERLRERLFTCADESLGLVVTEVNLRVTALLDGPGDTRLPRVAETSCDLSPASPEGDPAAAVAAVRGVAFLTSVMGRPVFVEPGHVRVELATAPGHRPLNVARAVRKALLAAVPDEPAVSVLVTAVGMR